MYLDINFIDYVVIFFGLLFCFKKAAGMERHPDLKDAILTSIVGAILVLFFVAFVSTLDPPVRYDCACAEQFTISEF